MCLIKSRWICMNLSLSCARMLFLSFPHSFCICICMYTHMRLYIHTKNMYAYLCAFMYIVSFIGKRRFRADSISMRAGSLSSIFQFSWQVRGKHGNRSSWEALAAPIAANGRLWSLYPEPSPHREEREQPFDLSVHYGHPKDEGLAANVNDSMDAGGMAAADVTQGL